ncbi:MAG: glycosyltransferase family A protein [Saprospiraceae bacterium]
MTTNLLAVQFDFPNQKLRDYSFFFVGTPPLEIGNLNLENLDHFFKENKISSVGFIKKQNFPKVKKELKIIQQKIDFNRSHFVVLLEYENPDLSRFQNSFPSEESFLISSNEFVRFYKREISTGLCYDFMLKALNIENSLEQIIVHQIGHPNPLIFEQRKSSRSTEVIMPHRGDSKDLLTALWYLEKQNVLARKVSVCFDEFVSAHHFKIADNNQQVRFFVNYPVGVGPYPSRDVLARATEEDVIVFHDSDDISTSNRISTLTHVLKNEKYDAVGSHELRINKIEKKLEAVRFPLEVMEKMVEQKKNYCMFFPSTGIKKSAYLKSGGLSTLRKHSSDSQFYRRAYFFLNLKNIDEFLYIRVKRENSLTTANKTYLGSPVRERLRNQWENDFIKIYNQNISLNESTLVDEPGVVSVDLIPLKKELQGAILKRQELTLFLQKENPFNQIAKPDFPKEEDIMKGRLLDYKVAKDPSVYILKQSFPWRIGWAITRILNLLFEWIPFVKKRV